MPKAPNLKAIKCLLRDGLSHGDQVEIADILGEKEVEISRQFSLSTNREPDLFKGLRQAWACTIKNQELGWKIRAYVNDLFDDWLSPVRPTEKNISALIAESQGRFAVMVSGRLEGKPLKDQKEELRAARAALDQLLAALDQEFELKADGNVEAFPKRERA